MLRLRIPKPEIKLLMNKLLREDTFDDFELRQAQVFTFAKFFIEDTGEQAETKVDWRVIRPIVFNIIKGNKTPSVIKIVFSLKKDRLAEICPEATVLFINILYENDEAFITTGFSAKTFTLDRKPEHICDDYVTAFLSSKGINAVEDI